MMPEAAHYNALSWVRQELDSSLARVQAQLLEYARSDKKDEQLRDCADLMHQVRGPLQIADLDGAGQLAAVIESVISNLLESEPDSRVQQLEMLAHGVQTLSTYISRLHSSADDEPKLLLPTINQLCSLYQVSQPENLRTRTIHSVELPDGVFQPCACSSDAERRGSARALRVRFQGALLAWYKKGFDSACARNLHAVLEQLRQAASDKAEARLWWVAAGVADALGAGLLAESVGLKQLFGKIDRQIKRHLDNSHPAFDDLQTDTLLEEMLHYIAAIAEGAAGGPVAEIISVFGLDRREPEDQGEDGEMSVSVQAVPGLLQDGVADLSAPGAEGGPIQQTGMAERGEAGHEEEPDRRPRLQAILKDIALCKETINDHLHGVVGGNPLTAAPVIMEKITFGLKEEGLKRPAAVCSRLEEFISTSMLEVDDFPDAACLDRFADAICSIEFYLEGLRDGRIFGDRIIQLAEDSIAQLGYPVSSNVVKAGEEGAAATGKTGAGSGASETCTTFEGPPSVAAMQLIDPDADSEILEVFIEESSEELCRLRELLVLLGPDVPPDGNLEEVRRCFHTLKGNSRMLGAFSFGECALVFEKLAGLAQDGQIDIDAGYLAAMTQGCNVLTQLLAQIKDHTQQPQIDVDAVVNRALQMAGENSGQVQVTTEEREEAVSSDPARGMDVTPERWSELPVLVADADAEIVEIFIEEADEEVAVLAETIREWFAAPAVNDAAVRIRRCMHTLKGSGRMAGALLLGEFAWHMENLLNRVIDGSASLDGRVVALISQLPVAIVQLLAQIRAGSEPEINIHALMLEAIDVCHSETAAAEPAASYAGRTQDNVTGGDVELLCTAENIHQEDLQSEDEHSLMQIYAREAKEIIQIVRSYLDEDSAGRIVPEPVYRALHTLSGISESVEVAYVGDLATGLDDYFSNHYREQSEVPAAALAVLSDCMEVIARQVEELPEQAIPGDVVEELQRRIAALESTPGEPDTTASTLSEIQPGNATDAACSTGAVSGQVGDVSDAATQDDPFADVDQELLEVFQEEAAEILDASERVLHAWADAPENSDNLTEYQRLLHTLKGNARMMNITAIGDLSHTLETLLTRIGEATVSVSANLFSTLFLAQDKLSGMLEQVRQRRMPADSAELEGELNRHAEIFVEEDESADSNGSAAAAVDDTTDDTADGISEAEVLSTGHVPAIPVAETSLAEEVGGVQNAIPSVYLEQVQDPATAGELPCREDADAIDLEVTAEPFPERSSREFSALPLKAASTSQSAGKNQPERRRGDLVKVNSELLDDLVNYAGEINIYRARMEAQIGDYKFNLGELEQTIGRLRGQLRKLEMETESQILYRYEKETDVNDQEFDPLELDRYSNLQESSRALTESISDLYSLLGLMENTTRDSETLLLQQSRVSTDLQEGLMRTRMIPFSGQETRLRRIVRQSASLLDKKVELELYGADGEMDRAVIERIIAPLEHMLRNAVAHGIEAPDVRVAAGKDDTGKISITFEREGPDIVLYIEDDGAGMDVAAIRDKALEKGLLDPGIDMPDSDVTQFVLQTGFSTAAEITQLSGRGVGLDVVNSEVKQLGGSLHIETARGSGTKFTIRLPYTLAINQALLVTAGTETYCIPLGNVEGVVRVQPQELLQGYLADEPQYVYAGNQYQLRHLATLLDASELDPGKMPERVPVLLMRIGEKRVALHVESLIGSREIVIKPLGTQLSSIDGLSGATILGDGRVVMILDIFALLRNNARVQLPVMWISASEERRLIVMVVDDSITVRKVTARLLERNGYKALTAKDGVDAIGQLQVSTPDIMLLDIEMPRMDGFELATHMRNDERLRHVPIVMITSRTGDKHRERARHIGVNNYLGKPYQETDLLDTIDRIIRAVPENPVAEHVSAQAG